MEAYNRPVNSKTKRTVTFTNTNILHIELKKKKK